MTISANRFDGRINEYIPSSPATGLGIFSLLDINRSLNLRYLLMRSFLLLNNFFYDRGFPTPGQTRKWYVPPLHLVAQFSVPIFLCQLSEEGDVDLGKHFANICAVAVTVRYRQISE